jgi:hypothetical protein
MQKGRQNTDHLHCFAALLRQVPFTRIACYYVTCAADHIGVDPAPRLATGRFNTNRQADF